MLVTLINSLSVVLGTIQGLILKKRLPSSFRTIVMTSSGLVTLVLGLSMAGSANSTLGVLFALIIGGFIGFGLRIEERIEAFGNKFQKEGEEGSFGLAFLNSSVLFCSGAMSIVGSINAGTTGDGSLILIKSVMDGFMAIVFAAALGIGTAFSALSVLVYQGALTLLAGLVAPYVHDIMLAELGATGGALIIMIGVNLMGLAKIKTANYLPALVLSVVFVVVQDVVGV